MRMIKLFALFHVRMRKAFYHAMWGQLTLRIRRYRSSLSKHLGSA